MSALLLREVEADGLRLSLTDTGTIKISGKREAIEKWTPALREHKPELVAELQKGVLGVHGVLAYQQNPPRTLYDSGGEEVHPAPDSVPWEQWQADHPSPGTVPLTTDEALDIRAWLTFIGETDPATIADVLRTCERFPDTLAHCLNQARTTEARQVIAARAALDAAQERAAILEHDAGMKRTEAERVSKLAEAFYNHLFGPAQATNCCYAPRGRYCNEGKKLKDAYYDAAKTAGKMA